jgi:hypothetical protein
MIADIDVRKSVDQNAVDEEKSAARRPRAGERIRFNWKE